MFLSVSNLVEMTGQRLPDPPDNFFISHLGDQSIQLASMQLSCCECFSFCPSTPSSKVALDILAVA
jgi:hypothetical protein